MSGVVSARERGVPQVQLASADMGDMAGGVECCAFVRTILLDRLAHTLRDTHNGHTAQRYYLHNPGTHPACPVDAIDHKPNNVHVRPMANP